METSYYNTIQATHPELNRYENKAKGQQAKILAEFKTFPWPTSPSQIWKRVFQERCLLTSVRRSMTTLCNNGDLVKTDKQIKGPHGAPEFLWDLAPKYNQREMLI